MSPKNEEAISIDVELDHLGLYVQNLDETIHWYNQHLGFKLSDYLPKGNTEEPVAPDGIAWMRYGKWHHDLTLIQVPDEAVNLNEEEVISNLKEICFYTNSKNALVNIYDHLPTSKITSEIKFDPTSKTSQFTTKDPDKNKIRILHHPSIVRRKEESHFSQINSLSHITIWSRDTEIAKQWYEKNLNFKEKINFEKDSIKMTNTQGDVKLIIDQIPKGSLKKNLSFAGRGTLQQIALKVKSEEVLLDSHDLLVKNKVEIVQAPRPQNWSSGTKFYFLDMDNIKIEIETGMKSVVDSYGSEYEVIKRLNLFH
tara:strand:- start:3196 stop:4128 length:933 start_codon:yes stop_codon:yes gene_type:complete